MQFVDLKKQYLNYKKDIDSEIASVLNDAAFIMGPKVKELEDKLKAYIGTKHAIAVSSGTDALLFCLMAMNIGAGDEVITTPFTFIASAEVISLVGAKPVFVDIDSVAYNIDISKIKGAITSKTKAIMGVSLYGQCADYKSINKIAKEAGIPVIEDACQSFGAKTEYGMSCGITEVGCTSFFPSKPLGCYGDGGMVFTNDDKLAEKINKIHVHGQAKRYYHEMLGTNGRLDALQAAILLAKFKYFDEELEKRIKVGNYYYEKLSGIEGIIAPKTLKGNRHVYAQFSIQVKERDKLATFLNEQKIPTAIHYPVPLHLQPVYSGMGLKTGSFPIAEKVASNIISLPMHPFMETSEQDFVIENIRKFLGK